MPLMAGSPGLSDEGCSGGWRKLLYSGGDERYARGRSAYQRGLCTSPRVCEEDEGRSQKAVANGRAENKSYKTRFIRKVWVGFGGARRGVREEGRIYESSVVTTAGNLCNTSRRWDREATQQGMVDDGRACVIRTAGWDADMRSHIAP